MNTTEPTKLNVKPGLSGGITPPDESWTEYLKGGTKVTIRSLHKKDIDLERSFIERMSPQSRHFRFLLEIKSPSDELLDLLLSINPETDVAYLALIDDGAGQRQIGVARFSAKLKESECEFAVTVSDEWQQKGLGRLLMNHLINAARARGIESMYSNDTADNDLMRKFADHLELEHHRNPDDMTQITYRLDLNKPLPVPSVVA